MVLLDFSMSPLGKGESVAPYVARCLEVVAASGLDYRLHAMGTTLEGEWDEVFAVVRRCFEALRPDCERVTCSIKVDYRAGPGGRLEGKVRRVEELLGRPLRTGVSPERQTDYPHRQLLAALGRVPSGLFILTARRGEAETGMLASWVQQCSFEPPRVSVALARGRDVAAWLTAGAPFTLNILDSTQTDMIVHFGRGFGPGEPAFEGLEIERDPDSGPVLADALACLQCRVASRCEAGDHDLLIADVVRGRLLGEGSPMVHVRKSGGHY